MRAVENISYCWYVDKKNKPTSPNRCHADQVSRFLFEHLTQVKRSLAMNLLSAGACYVFHLASYPFAKHTVYVANMSKWTVRHCVRNQRYLFVFWIYLRNKLTCFWVDLRTHRKKWKRDPKWQVGLKEWNRGEKWRRSLFLRKVEGNE